MTAEPKPKPAIPFPQALMRERARYQISRRELARHVGVSEGVIQKWERGESIPSTVQFKRLVTRLTRVAPHAPDWATHADQVLDGSADEYRREAAELRDKYADHLDRQEKPEPQEFHHGLQRVRDENGISQDELGPLLGVTGQAVSQWEAANALPVKENLLKLFELLPELKAGMETGAIKRPKWTQEISPPSGGRGFPRASTVDAALDMALAQSDEEAARPRQPKISWGSVWDGREHEHSFDMEVCDTDPAHDPTRSMSRMVCSICGAPRPDSKQHQEIRLAKPEHSVTAKLCPCGGSVSQAVPGGLWMCATCRRAMYEQQLIDPVTAQSKMSTASELAELYIKARIALRQARRAESAAQEALTNASTDRRNAEQEVKDAEALLEIAINEEDK